MTSTDTGVDLVAADAESDSAQTPADHVVALVVPARLETMAGTGSGCAAAEDNSAGKQTLPALAALAAVAKRPGDMLSVAAAAGPAGPSESRCSWRKPTYCDACLRTAGVVGLAPAGNGSWHSDAFVGAKGDENQGPAIAKGI